MARWSVHQDYDYIARMPGTVHRYRYSPRLRRYPGMWTLVAVRPRWSPPSPKSEPPVLRSATWPNTPEIVDRRSILRLEPAHLSLSLSILLNGEERKGERLSQLLARKTSNFKSSCSVEEALPLLLFIKQIGGEQPLAAVTRARRGELTIAGFRERGDNSPRPVVGEGRRTFRKNAGRRSRNRETGVGFTRARLFPNTKEFLLACRARRTRLLGRGGR